MKQMIKETLTTLGCDRWVKQGLNGLDDKLEKYLDYNNGFFIECGANDGITQSNTYYLEKRKNWRGILVEGIPELYKKCKTSRPKSLVYNNVLVAEDYTDSHMEMTFANLMSVVADTVLNKEKHIQSGLECQNIANSYTVSVPVTTLGNILKENNITEVDFFSLDVEGYELEVLKGIDLDNFNIKYILMEIQTEELKKSITERICKGGGYKLIDQLSQHDYLFKKV